MDGWLAALIVTVAYAAIAGVLALTGKSKVEEATPPVPEQTKESVREDWNGRRNARRQRGASETRTASRDPEPDEIRHEIEETREELGETVEALAKKADVKGRRRRKKARREAGRRQGEGGRGARQGQRGDTRAGEADGRSGRGACARAAGPCNRGRGAPRRCADRLDAREEVDPWPNSSIAPSVWLQRRRRHPRGRRLQADLEDRLPRGGSAEGKGERVRLARGPSRRSARGRDLRAREGGDRPRRRAGIREVDRRVARRLAEGGHGRDRKSIRAGASRGGPGPDTPTDLRTRSWGGVLKRTVTRVQGGQPHRLGGGADLLRDPVDLPELLVLVSLLGLIGELGNAAAAGQPRRRGTRPGAGDPHERHPEPPEEPGRCRDHLHRRSRRQRSGRRPATWRRSCARPTRSTTSMRAARSGRRCRCAWCSPLVLVVLLAICAMAVVLTGGLAKEAGKVLGVGDTAVTVWDIAKWPILVVLVSLMFAILYWAAPNVKQPGFRWISPGGVLAVIIWIVASAGVRLLRRQLRLVQQDLRRDRRRDHLPRLALDLEHRRPARRRVQRRAPARKADRSRAP